MVPLEAQYPGVYTDTFIFFLRSLCKIIWSNVHYFPNAPRNIQIIAETRKISAKVCGAELDAKPWRCEDDLEYAMLYIIFV